MSLGAFLYYLILALFSAGISYAILAAFLKRNVPTVTAHAAPAHTFTPSPRVSRPLGAEPPRSYSSHEGFRSFKRGNELTVDDIVTGLSRE